MILTRDSRDTVSEWDGLIHSLSGMFCASLASLTETTRADPQFAFNDMIADNELAEEQYLREKQYEWQTQLLKEMEEVMKERGEPLSGDWETLSNLPHSTITLLRNRERIMMENVNGIKTRLFYGEMPEEAVCTENLTPWSKLLPCRSESGLGSLLNSLHLYNALYHSMGANVRFVIPSQCESVSTFGIHLE